MGLVAGLGTASTLPGHDTAEHACAGRAVQLAPLETLGMTHVGPDFCPGSPVQKLAGNGAEHQHEGGRSRTTIFRALASIRFLVLLFLKHGITLDGQRSSLTG